MQADIRDMRLADIPAVAAIESVSFTSPWSVSSLRAEIGSCGSTARVVVLNGNIVGYVIAKKVLDETELFDLAVEPEHRRLGIARMLMENLIRLSRIDGVARIYLEVRASNAAAIGLYESLDFNETGVRKDYYQNPVEDALLMTLVI
jgi:[ribosomal protein S18]-alanine N-acetyltransferase